jgi:hypothetical protein
MFQMRVRCTPDCFGATLLRSGLNKTLGIMKKLRMLLVLLTLAASNFAAAETVSVWDAWKHGLHRQCPSHHVEWVGDGGYDELLGAFVATLDLNTQQRVSLVVDYKHRCASETAGFSCEMSTHLVAFRQLGLLGKFITFGCNNVKCEEAALCSVFPHQK